MPAHQIIHIQPLAATKPALGAACNGCGVCCLSEPCPLGVLLSRSRVGPCKALVWVVAERQYRCGALVPGRVGHGWAWLKGWLTSWLVRRWIAAGVGCDCDLEPTASATIGARSSTHSSTSNDDTHD